MLLASCENKPRHYLETYDKTSTYYNDVLRDVGEYQYNDKHLLSSSTVTFYKDSDSTEVDYVVSSALTYNDQSDITSLVIKQNDVEITSMAYGYAYNENKTKIVEYSAKGFTETDTYDYKESYFYDDLSRLTRVQHYEMDSDEYVQTQEIHYFYVGKMTDYIEKDTYTVNDSHLFINQTEVNTFNERNLVVKKVVTIGGPISTRSVYAYSYDDYNCLIDKGYVEEHDIEDGGDIYHSTYRAEYYHNLSDKPSYIFNYDEEISTTQKMTYDEYDRITSKTTYSTNYEIRTDFTYSALDWE